jgi:hypothetical protein
MWPEILPKLLATPVLGVERVSQLSDIAVFAGVSHLL